MKFSPRVEEFRIIKGFMATAEGEPYGAFRIPGPHGRTLLIIASSGDEQAGVEWEHVSVSTEKHTPTWGEMSFIKDLFWDEEETVMQLHVPKSRWINNHDRCLHLWRPLKQQIPLPPDRAVGLRNLGTLT